MNTTITVSSIVDSLIGAYRSHVLGHELPGPARVTFCPTGREIAVQAGGGTCLADRLGNLLAWAHTLAGATAVWSHTDTGRLHVKVTGRTRSGAALEVYGGGSFVECLGLVTLARGERDGVSLDELYALVGLLRDGLHEWEAA